MSKLLTQQADNGPQKLPDLWTKNFIFICLASLCNGIAFQSLLISLPLYVLKFGGSTNIAGLATAALMISAIIIRPFSGLALDIYGRKLIFALGIILFSLPSIMYIFYVPIFALLILRFIQGFGWGTTHTAMGTVASDIVPSIRLGEGMGTYNLANSISSVITPVISLWIIDQFSFRTLFVVVSLFSVASIILAQLIKYPKFEPHLQKRKLEFFSKAALLPALIVLFIGLVWSSILSFLVIFAQGKGIVNPGLFFTFMGITTFILRPVSGILLDRLWQRGFDLIIVIGVSSMVISLWLVASTGAMWQLVVAGALCGVGQGLILSAMLVMCINQLSDKHGLAIAIYGMTLDGGVAIGSIFWGIVANLIGYKMMFYSTSIPIILCLLVYFILRPTINSRQIAGTDHNNFGKGI